MTAFILLLSYLIYELTKTRLILKRRLKIAALGALFLTLYAFFCLQSHSVLFNREGILSAKISAIKGWGHAGGTRADPTRTKASKKKQNIIFINTSYNHSRYFFGDIQDSTDIIIADRQKLTKLFGMLSINRNKIDLVAMDLLFPEPLPQDDSLFNAIAPLKQKDGVLFAYYPGALVDNHNFYKNFDHESFGDVSKQKDEPVYYSHDIESEDGINHSFSYQMYGKLNKTNEEKDNLDGYVFHSFITEFSLLNEDSLYSNPVPVELQRQNENNGKRRAGSKLKPNVFTLGDAATASGQERILQKIDEIKKQGAQAIIFIGNLTDDYVDLHETTYGQMHGATIILNEFAYLENGYHIMSWFGFLLYLFTLWLFFFMILYMVLTKADKKDLRGQVNAAVDRSGNNYMQNFMEWVESILRFVWDESYYVLLFIMVLLINLLFHKLINIIGLIYLIPAFSVLLTYYIHLRNRENQN